MRKISDNDITVSILQPSYFPWLGYFEQINSCNIFVFLDDVQYTKNDWRNRNRIKTKEGFQWITVPVSYNFRQKIKDVPISNTYPWAKKHLQSFRTWYQRARFYDNYIGSLEKILKQPGIFLADLNIEIIQFLINKLGISLRIVRSSELSINVTDRQLRLVEICKALGGNRFYEGKSGQNYIEVELFKRHGITVEFQDYHHPFYNQLWLKEQGFVSHLSAIDLLFNHGPDSLAILTGEKTIKPPQGTRLRSTD